jgi:hypothetical protein
VNVVLEMLVVLGNILELHLPVIRLLWHLVEVLLKLFVFLDKGVVLGFPLNDFLSHIFVFNLKV